MADLMIERIVPGAAVECTDGRLGIVDEVFEGDGGRPARLRVTRGWTDQTVFVPASLVHTVRDDGTVVLRCSRDEAQAEHFDTTSIHDERTYRQPFDDAATLQAADLPVRTTHRPFSAAEYAAPDETDDLIGAESERTIPLHEEELVAHKEIRELGEVVVRTRVEEVPSRLEVEAYREEVEVEHVPVGQVVSERVAPWEEDGVLIVPIYEEQLVVTKRLVLREHLRVRRVGTTETHLFEDTLRRERVEVEDPANTGLVHELYPDDRDDDRSARPSGRKGGFFGL
jgi:uncharacterized protein (TIGR02271 family)